METALALIRKGFYLSIGFFIAKLVVNLIIEILDKLLGS